MTILTSGIFKFIGLLGRGDGSSKGGCCSCGSSGCSTLKCLCRPKFYSGQMLTDEDLNGLEDYVVNKNRLHNRFLHGWGVVCGLEVVCDPCTKNVIVRTGYAIDPCGDDIVVCEDATAQIDTLIADYYKEHRTGSSCNPNGQGVPDDCINHTNKWILAICYDERLSRGSRPLRDPGKSGCSCGCGGGSSCGCGQKNGKTATKVQTSANPFPCEPNSICEGYKFKLLRPPTPSSTDDDGTLDKLLSDPLVSKVLACLANIFNSLPKNEGTTNIEKAAYLCDLKDAMMRLLQQSNYHDCTLLSLVQAVECPDPGDNAFDQKFTAAKNALLQIVVSLFKSCFCSSLLPPCDDGSVGDCVPLAEITVRGSDYKVMSICNWSNRRFAVTVPMLGYWMNWLLSLLDIRGKIEDKCCAETERKNFEVDRSGSVIAGQRITMNRMTASSAATETEAKAEHPLTAMVTRLMSGGTSIDGFESLPLAALGLKAKGGRSLATEDELLNPVAAFMLGQVAAPIAESLRPTAKVETTATADTRFIALEKEMASLKKTVASQKKQIDKLTKAGTNR